MFELTGILPCTDDNRLYYRMAIKIAQDYTLGSRAQAVSRMKHLKEYAQKRQPIVYTHSPCKELAKLSPDSLEYYQALVEVLEWNEPWQIEDYWEWYKKRFNLLGLIFSPFASGIAAILNTALDMDCDKEDWNEALKIVTVIDLYRLANKQVAINVGDRTYTLRGV